ncbi:Amino Acid/Auxin Permease (AAAP) Family [Phytophthora cinnamomi]|uniref:Amino Acid/Auxin Permease (AAAP) Family n=1 Tax=Phytophthora cinnamomi TaxID=4785 RepID=UPI00355A985A|nr:Amino Acid/Auxin Permease (AAAP) Family [Phytophthora cinnamomi]
MTRGAFFTMEDAKIAFNLFCCVYGVGTLGMPGNFSRAGPAIAIVALVFMAFANVYASVAISKVMLLAPNTVRTYGDIGEWCMGKAGRYLVVLSQMGVCLLVPCVFLVLGGSLLDGLFSNAFDQKVWIVIMALMVLPVCLIPTLKEGAGAAFAGCAGTIIADCIGVAVVTHGMRGHPSVPGPQISFPQVASAFGNLSLAYGAGIVIPSLQRQHSDPTRMPRVVAVTLTFISVLFLVLASSGYSSMGCQISGNLLFTIYPDTATGLTSLGFASNWGAVVLAYLFMQLHVTIAFAVVVSPAFYIAERLVLGMHQQNTQERLPGDDVEAAISYDPTDEEAEAAEYRGANAIKYVLLRIAIVALQVLASVLLKDHFSDLSDFVGSSAITMSCIILPIVFYLKRCWTRVPMYEKVPALLVVFVCFVLGCYVTYLSGKELFAPSESDVNFPFCAPKYQDNVYYNYTAEHEA